MNFVVIFVVVLKSYFRHFALFSWLAVLAWALLNSSPINFSHAQSGAVNVGAISAIEIQGLRRLEKDAILAQMSIKPGSVATPQAVAADIRQIFSLGFFEDIRFVMKGSTLVVTLKERPVVSEIVYEGSEEFDEKELGETTGLKVFHVLKLRDIENAIQSIQKKYEEKGYYLARVRYRSEPAEDRPNAVKLIFTVTENQRVIVRRIFFSGNKHFPSSELKAPMVTSEGHMFSWATSGGSYRQDAFERDLALLSYLYKNDGFIDARISKPRVTLSQDRRYIDVFIDLEEGKQYVLGKVAFQSDEFFKSEELRAQFQMKAGDIFSIGKLQEQILRITDMYGDLGYAYANVVPRNTIREGTNIVDLAFDIEPGEKVYWGRISVTGNDKTHDKVVRRELPFYEGELYNATKRKKGVERVRRLGFFGNDISFLTKPGEGQTLDLEIKVQEKPTGSLNASLGFSSSQSWSFGAQIAQNNLFGLGQQLSFQTQLSSDTKTYQFSFTDPKVFDSEWLFGIDLYSIRGSVGSSFEQSLTGGSVRLGRELWEDVLLTGSYKLQRTQLENVISDGILLDPAKDKDFYTSSVKATLSWDTRNNRLDPSDGFYHSLAGEFAGLGGRPFQKYNLFTRYYRKLFWKVVFRSNFEYGLVGNAWSDEEVPVSELFTLGGVYSLRGYNPASVGPRVSVQNTRPSNLNPDNTLKNAAFFPYVRGGYQKLFTNLESEFPLIPEADIRMVFFFDVGNAYNSLNEESPSMLANWGWGIRWYSPLGPLRFEWGIPFSTHPDNLRKETVFNFIIAPTF